MAFSNPVSLVCENDLGVLHFSCYLLEIDFNPSLLMNATKYT